MVPSRRLEIPAATPSGPPAGALADQAAAEALAAGAACAQQLDHDVRTPLGALASALDLLKAAGEDAALREESLAVIGRQVQRLLGCAQRLHDLAETLKLAAQAGAGPAPPPGGKER